ncbi:MAG: AAA family ATPase [Kofleriaceae bacterium]
MEGGGPRPLSGRRAELATITSAIQRARDGQPQTLAIVGEPGIGKTRLASEAAAAAAARGFGVLWGKAWEAGGAPAYWPWRQICTTLPREHIAQLWSGRPVAAADPEQARFELFEAVTQALTTRAQHQPLLCIFDDLHIADVPSLELVAFATRHVHSCAVLWLATWRDAEAARAPVRDHLVRIAREAVTVPLHALSDIDANELIDHAHAGADVQLREQLVRATGGNPLFLLETLGAIATGHAIPLDRLPLAQGIAAIVRGRLAPLSDDVRALAEAGSAIGRELEVERWAAAAQMPSNAVRAAARELVASGLLRETPAGFRFDHDLVREAIYRGAGERTRELHARLAQLLDAEIREGNLQVVGERAHHALCARTDRAIEWTIAASTHARGQCAYEEAIAILERAVRELGPVAARSPALQIARGRAYLASGELETAREALTVAIGLARKASDPAILADAVLAFGSRYVLGDTMHDLLALIDEALAVLPSAERALQARLLARKAAALTPAPDPEPVLEMARKALGLVEHSGDDAARLEVAVAVGATFTGIASPRECIAVEDLVIALARAQADRALELRGLSRLVTAHLDAGDFARADAVLARRDELARSLRQPRFAWHEPLFRSMRAAGRGDFSHCDADVAEALALGGSDPNCTRACAIHRTWLLLLSDRVDELRAHEPTVLAAIRTMEPILATVIRAAIRWRAGELANARREIDALDPQLAHGRAPVILATLAEVAAELGPATLQRELYDLLAPHADRFAVFGLFGIVCGAPIAASLGLLAGSLGDLERARAHFDSALVMTSRAGAVVARAWTSYWYGRTLGRAGHSDATQLLDGAAREAEQLGIPDLAARCREAAMPRPQAPSSVRVIPTPGLAWALEPHAGAWRVAIADRSFLVPNLRGMAALARLSASPHVEVHSLELVAGGEPSDGGDAGELLDDKARAGYRKRLAALAEALEEATERGDLARAETIRDEHEALVKELSRAVGRGGRVRRAGAATERARVTAQRRLKEAVKKIGELDRELGDHLDQAIRTGTYCVYRP